MNIIILRSDELCSIDIAQIFSSMKPWSKYLYRERCKVVIFSMIVHYNPKLPCFALLNHCGAKVSGSAKSWSVIGRRVQCGWVCIDQQWSNIVCILFLEVTLHLVTRETRRPFCTFFKEILTNIDISYM